MRDLVTKLVRYGMTGGIAAVVDAGGFELLVRAGMGIAAGGTLSFCVAAVVNYWLTSAFVFGQSKRVIGFALFFVFAIVGLTINMAVTLAGVHWFDQVPIVAKVIGIGTAFLINFGLNTGIVFRSRS
jgi:putative flippase GtrA